MSSDMKDARWGLANYYAELKGNTFEDYTYAGWQRLLDIAQERLDQEPDDIAYWAAEFRREDEDYDPKWDDVHHGEMIW